MAALGNGSQHTALRADYDLEDEDRFFISGVEKAGAKRNTYELQLKRKKLIVGLGISIGVVGLVALILGLAYGLSRRKVGSGRRGLAQPLHSLRPGLLTGSRH